VAPRLRRYGALLCWSALLVAIDRALPGNSTAMAITSLPLAALAMHALYPFGAGPLHVSSAGGAVSALLAVGPDGEKIIETVSRRKPAWLRLAGVVTLTGSGVSPTRHLLQEVERSGTTLLLVDGSLERLGITGIAAVQERGVTVWWLADSLHRPARVRRLRGLAGLLWQPVPEIGLSRWRLAGKRAFDVTGVLVALPVVLPAGALIAAAVKLTSRGPAIYSQVRVGARGRLFVIRKFRTMVESAEANGRATMAGGRSDPRLTSLGRHLRDWRLDELPQLWNVLCNDMSLVGPRPERPVFVDEFAERIPEYHHRHLVPVGLTGLAQLTGDYVSSPEEKLQADLLYASNWSIVFDLALVARTAVALVSGSLDPDWIDAQAVPEELARISPLPVPSEAA
jgi:lipopolysaccharide/colanic/teichoic acid biosynthesis glycosyltransferase